MVTVLTAVLATLQELFNCANKTKHMKTVMPISKETDRQTSYNKDFCTCSIELEQVRSALSGREGGRQQDRFFPVGGEL